MNKQDRTYEILLITLSMLIGIMIGVGSMAFTPDKVVYSEPVDKTKTVYVYVKPEEPQTIKPIEQELSKEQDIKKPKETPTRGTPRRKHKEFVITAYDNTVESQGKWVNQTATGFNLKGHTLESAKCIAVDPKVIPLGSKVELIFDNNYKHLNGVYIARDTGGAIKGNKIDLFMGDCVSKKTVRNFGRRKVQVNILE